MKAGIIWTVGVALVVVAAMVLAGGWVGCDRAIHPVRKEPTYTLAQFDLPRPEPVFFPSRDDINLAGWFLPGTSGATVVLVHGRRGSRAHMLPHAGYLHRAGFSVLLFDLRHRGKSGGEASSLGAKETWDVLAAVNYLVTRVDIDPERIGVQGNSLGGVASLLAAAEMPRIRGVVAEGPYTDLRSIIVHAFDHPREGVGLPSFPFAPVATLVCETRLGIDVDQVSPLSSIADISPRPILLIDDLGDDLLPRGSVKRLYRAAGEPKDLWQVAAAHGRGWEAEPAEYERRVLAFWRRTLRSG